MFYRITAAALGILGVYEIISHLSFPLNFTPDVLEKTAIGLLAILLGLLNLNYFYDSRHGVVQRVIFFSANLVFMGFAILLITTQRAPEYGYLAVALSLVNCVMALNHKV